MKHTINSFYGNESLTNNANHKFVALRLDFILSFILIDIRWSIDWPGEKV